MVLGLVLVAVFVALVFLTDQAESVSPVGDAPEYPSEATTAEQAIRELPAPAVGVTGDREAVGSPAESAIGDSGDEFELVDSSRLIGRVVVDGYIPADDGTTVVLSAFRSDPATSSDLPHFSLMFGGTAFLEVARVPVAADGRFDVPRVLNATHIRLKVDGDYVRGGLLEFEVGSDRDPGEGPVELKATIGAHMTFVLRYPDDATEAECEGLVGRPFQLSGLPPNAMGRPTDFAYVIAPGGVVIARGIPAWNLRYDRPSGMEELGPGLAPFTMPWGFRVTPQAGERQRVDVELLRGTALAGTVVASDGTPLAGADVRVGCSFQVPSASGRQNFFATSADDGTFRFQGLPDGIESLRAEAKGRLAVEVRGAALDALLEQREGIRLVVPDGGSLHGRVTLADGRPIAQLQVLVTAVDSHPRDRATVRATTDADGLFMVSGLSESDHRVSAKGWFDETAAEGSAVHLTRAPTQDSTGAIRLTLSATVPVPGSSAESPVELMLTPTPVLRGRVIDATGSLLSACRVYFGPTESVRRAFDMMGGVMLGSVGKEHRVDPSSGQFSIEGIDPGPITVWAQVGRGLDARLSDLVDVDLSRDTAPLELVLPTQSAIAGTIVDESGVLVAGVTVTAHYQGRVGMMPKGSVTSDAQGRFEIGGLESGQYYLRVTGSGFLSVEGVTVDLAIGEQRDGIVMHAVRGGEVEITLIGAGGDPLAATVPYVRTLEGRRVAGGHSGETGPSGVAIIGPLAPGTIRVGLNVPVGEAAFRRVTETVTVEPGGLVKVTVDANTVAVSNCSGLVLSAGAAVVQYRVALSNDSGRLAETVTDELGRFTLEAEAIGAMSLSVVDATTRCTVASRTVELTDGGEHTFDFDLPTGEIRGRLSEELPMGSGFGLRIEAVPDGQDLDVVDRTKAVQLRNGGTFWLRYLAPGRYTLIARFRRPDEEAVYSITPKIVTLSAGQHLKDVVLDVVAR